jgi:hypothetical protein
MAIFLDIIDVLLILVFLGFIGVIVAIGSACLKLKNEAVRSANRLNGPIKSTKNIIVAGKGVYDQEGVRVRRIIKRGTVTVRKVAETAEDLKVAAEGLKQIDFVAIQAHSKEIARIISLITEIYKSVNRQRRESH